MELRIRALPDPVGRRLKALAALQGKPFNALLIEVLSEAADRIGPETPKTRK